MHAYLAAHDEFVAWLEGLDEAPTTSEVDRRLWTLALCAADRGMTPTHWTFVVDGLVAHVNRQSPGNILLTSDIARGFDLSRRWDAVESASVPAMSDVCARGAIG
jgi:hypothetical protein